MPKNRIEVMRPEYPEPVIVEKYNGGIRLKGRYDTFWIKEPETFRRVAFAILELTDPPGLTTHPPAEQDAEP